MDAYVAKKNYIRASNETYNSFIQMEWLHWQLRKKESAVEDYLNGGIEAHYEGYEMARDLTQLNSSKIRIKKFQ